MSYSHFYTPTYADCVRAFATDAKLNVDLMEALAQLAEQPFGNPKLQTHAMKGIKAKRFISYVGNRGHRLIWQLLDQTIVLLLFGAHDAVERRAERLNLEIDIEQGHARVVDVDPANEQPLAYARRRQREGALFMAWNDAELAGCGFESQEIAVLRRLNEQFELTDLEAQMRPPAFELAFNLVAYGNPEGTVATPESLAAEEPAPFALVDEAELARERELEQAVRRPASRPEFAPVEADALADVLSKPIEDWMVFLHPDQVRLTERPFAGPARVRGAAGTGKTVVALHRARHLADTYGGKVLFTTYVANLPPVFAELYRRLSPSTADRVEFTNLHRWAWRFVAKHDRKPNTDPAATSAAYGQSWDQVVKPGSYIERRGYGRAYYRDEIDWVIKGRGLPSLDAYLGLARTGRGSPLTEPHRREVWELHSEYERQLRRKGVIDFNDLLSAALDLIRDGALDRPYDAVLVDEAQDLTEVGVRLAYELGGRDKRDGLFLVGDGQQAVYPGGYSLGSVGIDVRGRSSLLRVNYRNTRQILDAANRLVEDRPFDDLDEQPEVGSRDVTCLREGAQPVFAGFATVAEHDLAVVAAIDDAAQRPGIGSGDLAVLLPTNKMVTAYAQQIRDLGYATVDLQRYDGTPGDEVKVGTYQRGKGLEFKGVFLPHLDPAALGEHKRFNEDDDAYAERIELLRRRLFVSMTRARDRLWCGWVGEPSALLRLPSDPHTPGDV